MKKKLNQHIQYSYTSDKAGLLVWQFVLSNSNFECLFRWTVAIGRINHDEERVFSFLVLVVKSPGEHEHYFFFGGVLPLNLSAY